MLTTVIVCYSEKMAKICALEEAKKVILTQWTKKIIVEKQMTSYDNLQEPLVGL